MSDNKVFHDVQQEEKPRKPFYFPSLILGLLAIACTFFNVASVGQIFGLLGVIFALRRREAFFVIPSLIVSAKGELVGIIGNAVLVVVVLDGGLDRFLCQNRAVELVGGQSVQSLDHRLVGQFKGLTHRLALDQFGSHGAGGNCAAAAEGLELGVGNDVIVDLQIHLHNISALGVTHLADAVRIGDLTHIAGVAEVVHYLFTV